MKLVKNRKYWLVFVVIFGFFSIQAITLDRDKLYEIARNLEIFTNIFKELNKNYVEEIDPAILMKTGIDAMLASLDPFTNYISEARVESFRISTEGKYSGIGAIVREMDGGLVVFELYEDSPALEAGLLLGDEVVEVNGQSTKDKTSEELTEFLRGAPGTAVELLIKREGQEKPMKMNLMRKEINVPNVPHQQLIDNDIAYIHLSTFSEDAGSNVKKALTQLKEEKKLNGIILDLRSNGGGLLREAIAVCNVFIDNEIEIVSTRGKVKERDMVYKTNVAAYDTTTRLVVLIDNKSASASEIVAGSVQDLDRGVLVGQKSYGKGSVQNTAEVGYNSRIKLTTSKYYIPSGRSIQSVKYQNGEPVDIPEKDRKIYYTKKGRPVTGGGGVIPDVVVTKELHPDFVKHLLSQHVIFKYVNQYYRTHDSIPENVEYAFREYGDFIQFYKRMDLKYKSDVERKLELLKKSLEESDDNMVKQISLGDLENKLVVDTDKLFEKYRKAIVFEIEKEIISRYQFKKGKIRHAMRNDPELEKAIELIRNEAEYKKILHI
jgi:carboxyl-terminal processing protease